MAAVTHLVFAFQAECTQKLQRVNTIHIRGHSIRSSYEWVDVAGEIGTELHEYKCADQSSAISQIRIAGQSTTDSSRFSRGLDGKFLSGIFDDLIGLQLQPLRSRVQQTPT